MLLSIALILLCGMGLGWIFEKFHLPSLAGMLIAGIILGPYVFNLLDSSMLEISEDIRKIALIIILARAGLSLNLDDLKKVGRPALMMCCVPACFEILGTFLFAPILLGITPLEALVLGSVLAAVSPAVIVPKMIKLIEEGYGTQQSIPQMILAGASVDDVFVIVLFTSFTSLIQGQSVSLQSFISIPISIIMGIIIGYILGLLLRKYFDRFCIPSTMQVLLLLCVSFILVTIEDFNFFPFASLISVMSIGVSLQNKKPQVVKELAGKLNTLWIPAQVFLFVLVGACVNIQYALDAGWISLLLIVIVLCFRMAGVFTCMLKTKLNSKERLFCMIAYTPKATVQAAIGAIPLSMGLSCGNIVLTIAVVSILFTAPVGAFMIEQTYRKLLTKTSYSES